MKQLYGERAHLLFTDTDSLMYHIVIEPGGDFYQDMIDHKDYFDLSNYPPTHPYYEPALGRNKAVLGKMKDEAGGHAISEFVGLRPKMYS